MQSHKRNPVFRIIHPVHIGYQCYLLQKFIQGWVLRVFTVADRLVHEFLNVFHTGLKLNFALSLEFLFITGVCENLLYHLANGSTAI